MIVSGDDERLVIPEVEEDRHLSVALIAVDSLDRPGANVKVTRNAGAGMAAFVEATEEASVSDVRRAFSTLGMTYTRFPDELDSPMVTYVQAADGITFRHDDDPFFDEVSEAVATLRNRDRMSLVNGYGEAYALVMGGRISEMIGNTRTLVRD